jgi:hypothetical protein
MLISDKQHEANQQNAQHSTGPKTLEGKQAVRFNALSWGLRASSLLIGPDDDADYQELWNCLEDEWCPKTHTELHFLEQMCISQWLLTRNARNERRIHRMSQMPLEKQLALLDRAGVQRVRLERSFTASMRELKLLQKERAHPDAQPPKHNPGPQPQPPAPDPSADSAPRGSYVMAEGPDPHPVFCSPAATDTR